MNKRRIGEVFMEAIERRDIAEQEEKAWLETLERLSYKDLCVLWARTDNEHLVKRNMVIRRAFQVQLHKKFPLSLMEVY